MDHHSRPSFQSAKNGQDCGGVFCRVIFGKILHFLILGILVLSGCNIIPQAAHPLRRAEATSVPGKTSLPVSASSPVSPGLTLPPPRLRIATIAPSLNTLSSPRDQYKIDLSLDYDRHAAQVSETISAHNDSTDRWSELVVVIEPNRLKNVFSLKSLQWGDGSKIDHFEMRTGSIRIPLEKPVEPGGEINLQITYDLAIPPASSFLAYTGRQINLGDWYPFLPVYKNGQGWLVHDPSPVGEHLVYPSADYQVRLTLAKSARPLVVAASAQGQVSGENTYQFSLQGGRSFAFSVSPDYQVLEGKNGVKTYVFPNDHTAGQASLDTAQEAITLFSDWYGAYPYQSLAVVEADFFDGMEYSGLFFLGADYYAAYPNAPTSYLVPLSAHETAHQWWYSLVGDDPAEEPWLDEAMCTYSELIFYQAYYPKLVDWWWYYRINRFDPQGQINITIYDLPQFRPYVNAVYLQGVRFMDAVRKRVGEEAFRAFLKDYSKSFSYKIVTRADFFDTLKKHTGQDISDLIQQYFRK